MPFIFKVPPSNWTNWDGSNNGPEQVLVSGFPSQSTMERVGINTFAMAYNDDLNGLKGTVLIFQISGTTITPGPTFSFTNDIGVRPVIAPLENLSSDTGRFIVGWTKSSYVKAAVISYSGTTISSIGAVNTLKSTSGLGGFTIEQLTTNKAIATYNDAFVGNPANFARVLTVSGTTISAGTELNFGRASARYLDASDISDSISVHSPTYATLIGATTHAFAEATTLTISGTNVTAGISVITGSSVTAQGEKFASVNLDASRSYFGWGTIDDNNYCYGQILTSIGGIVTPGGNTVQITETTNNVDAILVGVDTILLSAVSGTTAKLRVFTINGNVINPIGNAVVYSGMTAVRLAPTAVPNTKVMVTNDGKTRLLNL